MVISKILVPIDFSKRAHVAAHWAKSIARRFGSDIIVLHVMDGLPGVPRETTPAVVDADVTGPVLGRLLMDAELSEALRGCNVRWVVVEGDPAEKIVEFAHSEGVDLIVMPTRGRGPVRGLVFGSITDKVLRNARCPVWTGTEMATDTDFSVARRILCAVALGPQSARALRWASKLASSTRARLTVVHADPALDTLPGRYFDVEWRLHLRRTIRADIARLQADAGAKAGVQIKAGQPAKAVASAVADLAGDVLVIGRSPEARFFGGLRTTSFGIIREAPCPVVSV